MKKKFKFPIFTIISCIIVLMCLAYIVIYINGINSNNKVMDEVKESITYTLDDSSIDNNAKIIIDFDKLKQINSDIVGYLIVNNTNIDYPVVKYTDNSYYLNHGIDKSYNTIGAIFMDYRNILDGNDKNIIIYGHNIKNGSMFGTLDYALNSSWQDNSDNLSITYIDESGTYTYQIFSIYQIEKETYYTTTYFSSTDEYQEFIDTIVSRSVKDFNVSVTTSDQVLTLSTCADNNKYRVVVHAKKL